MGSFAIIFYFFINDTMYSLFIKCSYRYDVFVKSHKSTIFLFFGFFTLFKVLKCSALLGRRLL